MSRRFIRMNWRLLCEKCCAEAASAKAICLSKVRRVREAVPMSGKGEEMSSQ